MAHRREEKERLRQERLARVQAEQERTRRRQRVYGFAAAGVLIIAATLAIAVVFAVGGGGTEEASGSPFGQHYDGLEERRAAANVTTMMDTMQSTAHFHPEVRIYVRGKRIKAPPANVGIDPDKPSMDMASLHTHDAGGTIHVEGMEKAKLGQLFMVWGVPLSTSRLGPYLATKRKRIKMWVDDRPSRAFGSLELRDKQQIVISYGTRAQDPIKNHPTQ